MALLDRCCDCCHADLVDLLPWAVIWGAIPIVVTLIGWFWPKGDPEDEA